MESEEPRIKITGVKVSDQYCRDVLVCCTEGGSQSWAFFRNIERDSEDDIHSFEVTEGEDPQERPGWHKISVENIRSAVVFILKTEFKISDEIKRRILEDENDAESSDVLLQAALFGKIVYG